MDVDVRRRRDLFETGSEGDGLDGFWRAGAGRCGVYTGQECLEDKSLKKDDTERDHRDDDCRNTHHHGALLSGLSR